MIYKIVMFTLLVSMCTGCNAKTEHKAIPSGDDLNKIMLEQGAITEIASDRANDNINQNEKSYQQVSNIYNSYNCAYFNYLYPELNKLDIEYDEVFTLHDEYYIHDEYGYKEIPAEIFVIKTSDKYGVIDTDGNFIIEPILDNVECGQAGLANIKKDGLWGAINYKGEVISECKYKSIDYFKNGIARVISEDNKYGYLNLYGHEIAEPIWDFAADYTHNVGVVNDDENYHILDTEGKILFSGDWVDAQVIKFTTMYEDSPDYRADADLSMKEVLIRTYKNDKYALMNIEGDYLTDFAFSYLPTHVTGNVIQFAKDNQAGLLNFKGEIIFEGEYSIYTDESGMSVRPGMQIYFCDKNGRYVILSPDGKLINDHGWDDIYPIAFYEGAFVKEDGKLGFINSIGSLSIDMVIDEIVTWSEGEHFYIVKAGSQYSIVNTEKGEISKTDFDAYYKVQSYQNDEVNQRLFVSDNSNWLLIDKDGETIADFKSSDVELCTYEDEFAVIRIDNLHYLLNCISGEMHIINGLDDNIRLEIKRTDDNIIYLKSKTLSGYKLMNEDGDILLETQTDLEVIEENLILLSGNNSKKSLYNLISGETELEYLDNITHLNGKYYMVEDSSKFYIVML